MFHFPTFPPHTLYIQMRVTRHHSCWVSPFGHPRISARLTAPRGLSQPPTSFIGSWCQGIHRTLLHTYNKDARVHCAVLKQHTLSNKLSTMTTRKRGMPDIRKNRYLALRQTLTCSLRTQQYVDIFPSNPAQGPASYEEKLVSVPPVSSCRSTYGNETGSARRLLNQR